MERDLWLSLRRKGVSGTDCSAVMGDNPYKTKLDVWKEKVGVFHKSFSLPGSVERMAMGNQLEPIVAKNYAKSIGRWLVPGKFTVIDWKRGTPDFLFYDCKEGLEIKTTGSDKIKKNLEKGVFEPYWVWQARWYMMLMDYDIWHIAALSNGQKMYSTIITRDIEIENKMVDECSIFWHENVLKLIPPEL